MTHYYPFTQLCVNIKNFYIAFVVVWDGLLDLEPCTCWHAPLNEIFTYIQILKIVSFSFSKYTKVLIAFLPFKERIMFGPLSLVDWREFFSSHCPHSTFPNHLHVKEYRNTECGLTPFKFWETCKWSLLFTNYHKYHFLIFVKILLSTN